MPEHALQNKPVNERDQAQLVACIRELLAEHPCVILPGFGGFVGRYSSAKINRRHQRIDPPRKQILFNRGLTVNDGLLADYVGRRFGCSFQEAINWIEKEQHRWQMKLATRKRLRLEGLGMIRQLEDGRWEFVQPPQVNLLPEAYGLPSLPCVPVSSRKNGNPTRSVLHTGQRLPSRAVLTLMLLAFFSGVAGAGIWMYQHELPLAEAGLAGLSKDEQAEVAQARAMSPKVASSTTGKSENEEAPEKNFEQPPKPDPGLRHYVIVGAFEDLDRARDHVQKWAERGHQAHLLRTTDSPGLYRISVYRTHEAEQAHQLKAQLQSQTQDSIWILTR